MNYIFDFDGTIVDSFPAVLKIYNENIRGNQNPLSAEEVEELRNMTSRRAVKALGIRWWHVPRLLLQGLPDFYKELPSLKSFQGLPEVLSQMHERGDKLFIVTSNTGESVELFIKNEKLDRYFTDIVAGAGIFKKAKHIRKLIKKYKLKRKETFYVGDETRDIRAARMARVNVIAVTWGFNTKKILLKQRPAFTVDKPKELLEINAN